MRTLRGREKALLGLLVVVGLVQGVRMLLPLVGSGGAATATTGASGARREAEGVKLAQALKLDLDALAAGSEEIDIGRDPFRFAAPPPPPPPPPRPAPPPPPPPPPPLGPQPPPVDVTFLGTFGPPQRRIAVFSDGKTIYNALRGEILHGKFQVHAIGYESVDLTFVGFPDVPPERLAVGG